MKLDDIASQIIVTATNEARYNNHEYITPEHILYAALFFEEGSRIITACGGDVEKLKEELKDYLEKNIPTYKDGGPFESVSFQNVMHNTAVHALSAGKDTIRIGDILVSMFEEKESYAKFFLQKEGITKLDILNYISHGVTKVGNDFDAFADESYHELPVEDDERPRKKKGDFLKNFTIDLTEKAKNGELDPVIGRDDILKRTLQVLCRRLKNNPVHVGDPGVGKTAITEGLAQLIVKNQVPSVLKDYKIYYLDMGALIAGTKFRGDFEERIKRVLNQIQKQEKAILYIDEIHTIVGAGAVSGGALDASNILKPFLTTGKLRCIGSTTYEEYKKYFEKDRALSRRFQKIEIPEPSIDDTVKILQGLKAKYEAFHNVIFTDKAILAAAELSAKYINDRFLPDKAIDVIDETGAFARMHADKNNIDEKLTITEKEIEQTVSLIAKVPVQSVTVDETIVLKELDKLIKKEIFGQDDAIDKVVRAIKQSRAGFNEAQKPVASLLFVGPTGVGKTELARQIAEKLGIPLLRFDMSEYQEKHTVSRLIGSPPGYVGYEEGGLLTDEIRKNPYSVLLLDEIEKAHQDIFNILLQVMDYATLTDNNGKKADFRNVILIMTSNAGAREIGKNLVGFGDRKITREIMLKEIETTFSPEFRNRLDGVVTFNHINSVMALQIAEKAIKQFEQKLKIKNITLEVSKKCYEWLANKALSSIFGAREIYRIVQDKIKPFFVDEVLFGKLSSGGVAIIDVKEDDVSITIKGNKN